MYLRTISLRRDDVPSFDDYPYSIPAIRTLDQLDLDPKVTFFVGENGCGKSTLLEAIAIAAGFNAEGGSKSFRFATARSESDLHMRLRIARGVRRERDGFFLRAESFFNAATYLDAIEVQYGDRSLHEQSHGESFLALVTERFGNHGLYLLDEPEAALSPGRQLALLKVIDRLVRRGSSQFLIATHSPILMAYPHATIYALSTSGMAPIDYEDTEHFQITRDFLANREAFLEHLLRNDEPAVT